MTSRFFPKLLLALLLAIGATNANAGLFCSEAPFFGVVDGAERAELGGSYTGTAADPFVTQITIDTDCTFVNFPASDPLTVTLNFQTNDPSVYLITFDNVVFTGNMACANIDHRIWFVNGSDYGSNNNCQDLFIPVEAINKQNPAGVTTVGIGEPFTYTLNIPVLYDPATGTYLDNFGSANGLHSITITDDLNATGADLTVVGTPTVTWLSGANAGDPVPHSYSNVGGLLTFEIDPASNPGVIIPAGDQLQIAITVVADNTNVVGTQFVNTAAWSFGRLINIDLDGDGIPEPNFFDPLPGENGVTEPLTIGGPDLTLTKTNPDTALNLAATTTFTLDVQNIGSTNAWNATILDLLPDSGVGATGMCDFDPTATVTAEIFEADGTTSVSGPLVQGMDYTVSYTGAPTCELSFSMSSVNAVIGPSERLIITYDSQLDLDTVVADDGTVYTNYAGVTEWFSGDPLGGYDVITFTQPDPVTGTPGTLDYEDSHSITAALTGYIFQKTVENVTSGVNPATSAFPGDTLRYRLRLFNFTEVIDGLTITDTLDPTLFNTATSFNMVTPLPDGVADYSFNTGTGELQIFGDGGDLDLDPGVSPELVIEFEIDVAAGLANGTMVPNQALAETTGAPAISTLSDDPYVNGVFDPLQPVGPTNLLDQTVVTVQGPGALLKENPVQTTYTIGDQFTYTITVPAVAVGVPLYDVRILDNLTANGAELSFVSATVVSAHSWTLTNTGTSNDIVIEDTGSGIDIPANEQAVIEATVQVQNTLPNQQSVTFNNRAFYTYNRINGDIDTQTDGVTDPATDTTPNMSLVEPNISTITKTADNTTPTAGETVRYSITLTASGGADLSDVFDVQLIDSLDLGLVYAGNPTVTTGGGVSADNTIGAPDITGDGTTTAQTLEWNVGNADIDIEAGAFITVEYDVQVLDSVLANQTLDNSVVAQWSSVDGSVSGERTGIDGIGGLNDYETPAAVETLTIADIAATILKERTDDTYVTGDDDVRIGDIVDYTITLSIPEGTLGNLQLVDTLPQGLDFEGVVSINGITAAPYTAVAPFSHADILAASIVEAGDPAAGPTTVTWSLGDVNNQPIDDTANNFVIVYRARVMDGVLTQVDTTALNNTVVMSYDTAVTTVNQSDIDTTINVLQPILSVTKSAIPAGGDVLIVANETIEYTVDIFNSGLAPAYDVVLQDTIPAGLRNGAATVTIVSSDLVSVAGYAPLAPTSYDAGTGVVTWNFDSGVADDYSIPPGETLRVVYTVQADPAIAQGLILTNAALVNTYYSFDDDAVPTVGTVSGTREIYGPSNTDTTTLYTGSLPTKALIFPAPASPDATIGEEVIYQITIPGTVSASTLYDLQVTDTLDTNLEFVSANVVGGIGITDTSVATQMNIAIDEIPAGTQAVIELTARVRNVLTAQQGVDINNTVSYTYAFVDGGPIQPALISTDIVTVNIIEPNIGAVTKTADNTAPTADEVVRYSVVLAADGGADNSDVFDVTITDTLDLGLVYEGNPWVTDGGGVSADNTIGAPVITGDGVAIPQTLVWSLANGNADIDIVEGTPITIEYDVRVLNTVLAGQVLNNTVVADWSGIDGESIYERDGSDGIGNLNDYITAPVIETLNTPNINITINKVRSDDTYGAGDDDVRIGDIVEYTFTLSVPEGTVDNLQVVDTLPQGLDFEGVVSINGDTVAPYSAVAPFTHADIPAANVTEVGDPTAGPTTVTWDMGTLSNQPVDDASNDFVIVYQARVLENVFAQVNTTPLNNTVTVSYDTATGTINNSDIDTVVNIQQPDLVVSKSASAAGGDAEIVANELVTYTVSVVNNGTAPAYDLVLEDVIPVGLRNGTATITMVSIALAGAPVGNVTPTYDPLTGIAIWDFDTGVANAYTIGATETLTIVYRVQADANLGANLVMTNAATGTDYYSFDDEAVPTQGGVIGVREAYGPTNTATSTLTSPVAGALAKINPADTTVSVGETFTYQITVPATPLAVDLYDVRILDDISLAATGADLSLVNVAVSPLQTWVAPWTPTNTGTATDLVIEDATIGIDIPAGEQAIIDVTVQVDDTGNNTSGTLFTNTADYTFNRYNDTPVSQLDVLLPVTTGNMEIVGPDTLTLQKTGPPTIRVGLPGTYTLDIHNTGTAPAYDVTIEDVLPNLATGGMCDTTPYNVTAQIYDGGGATVGGPLVLNTDFTLNFVFGAPTCDLSFAMVTPTAAIPADHHLVISYDVQLDNDSANNVSLTNIAGATEWFSQDTAGAGATGETRTYTRVLNDAVTAAAALDHEDAYTTVTESPTIQFRKYVVNNITGQNPGTDASPGDELHYRIEAVNVSPVEVPVFSIIDDLGALNTPPVFAQGPLQNLTVNGSTYTDNSLANGGTNNMPLVNISDLSMSAAGGGSDTITIEFDITLADVINSGTLVLNQAQLQIYNLPALPSDDIYVNGADDPFIPGGEDPTQTLIASASLFQVQKVSDDISGSATDLLPGDTLRYTITVKNVGDENAVNATLQDNIPADTTYVLNSTTLNGVTVPDVGGNSPLLAGMLIYADEDPTPGAMRAGIDPLATNVATITFDVTINADAVEGEVISNQAQLTADGAGISGAVVQPSDDPVLNGVDDPAVAGDEDPTLDTVSRPNGVIYDSISRQPIGGATVRLLRASDNGIVPGTCFSDPAQQDQVTSSSGAYKFNLVNFNAVDCPDGANYLISIIAAPQGYDVSFWPSRYIPPTSDATTAAYSVPVCPADAVAVPVGRCEARTTGSVPTGPVATPYYVHMTFGSNVVDNTTTPPTTTDVNNQIFNNHIPLDSELAAALTITKTSPLVNVTRGQLVPYTITLRNTLGGTLTNMAMFDQLPPGFKYVEGSGRFNGSPLEPIISTNGRQLQWNSLDIIFDQTYTFQFLLVVSSGVSEGEYVNQAWVQDAITGSVSDIATATVRVVPDPAMDCSDVIGKVFDDRNLNGYQDEGEPGIGGARIATARGLLVTTDKHGRFHVTCAVVPNEDRGSNFILKLDERTLPTGYRVTTENPRVQRVTRGKMVRFNFGATVHHVVTLSVADGAFSSNSAEVRPQWTPRLGLLIEELRKQASVLRISYLADVETKGLVDDRMAMLKENIQEHWEQVSEDELVIEAEVFWRHGGPVDKKLNIADSTGIVDYVSTVFARENFGEDTERQLPYGYTYRPWMQDPEQFKNKDEVKFEVKQVAEKKYTTKKLKGLVPPLLFKSGKADISEEYVSKLRDILNSMRDRINVRLHFIGHTDNVKLRGLLKQQYEDNVGLSKERAGTTAEFFQRALVLPPESISYEGMGEANPVASNNSAVGRAQNRRVEVQVWYDEVDEQLVDRKIEVDQEIKRVMVCRVETVCKLRYKDGHSRKAKLKNLVPPFHYDEGISEIPAQYLQQLRQALQNLASKDNVQMRFIAYTDNIPLTGRDERIYGDHVGLSKANARRVAIAVQEALGLSNADVNSTGRGAASPIASNNSEKGRALNRRIEVEFWHDDPLEDLPEEPQICPEASAAETVERIYNPPEGDIQPVYYENGKAVIPDGYTKALLRAMEDISDKGNVRLRFIGYTSNKRLSRRTAMVYGDDVGLSTARARRAMDAIKEQMGLTDQQAEFEGRGYVQSHDVVNTGFVELDRSKVEVQVVYDELAVLDESEGVSIKRLIRDVETKNPFALNLMRISVDGQPVNDPNKNIPDVQRCTDVALDKAKVRYKFDNLQTKPRLNVTAWPNVISHFDSADTEFVENVTHFKLYSNYPWMINKAEVRLFKAEQSTRDTPVAVVPVNEQDRAQWQYNLEDYSAPRMQMKYVLRIYDKQGNFDETAEQSLWIVDLLETDNSDRDASKELLVGYGENRLAVNNIKLNGGAVSVYGEQVPEGHKVWFAGREIPVNSEGKFGGEFIIPSGLHTVEVSITDQAGNGHVYQRDLEMENSDWFYVGIADLTAGIDNTNGPANIITGDDTHYGDELSLDGRLAFYAKGKFANEATLTASADTREGPVDDLFSNFMDKSPEALFRRFDPDDFYPTFGDDSTVEEGAPTSGKFYVKYQKDKNYGLWGNFNIAYTDNELAHVDRGLYGANINYESDNATDFGEKRYAVNMFAAEPGTVAGRDEFLGTGGSLYYLRHQDILQGSERIRIEVRDAVSGLVTSVKNLVNGLDYTIDYIQGRIMLTEPVSASIASGSLVVSSDFGGSDVMVVARYEYTPGFEDFNEVITGGRAHYWFTDQVKLGITLEDHGEVDEATSLSAYDLTWRKNAGTWVKLQQSTSQGPVSSTLSSSDGGYSFNESALAPGTDVTAKGQRLDASVRLEDVFDGINGTFTFYNQQLDAGYAAPGLIALTDTTQAGGTLKMPVHKQVNMQLKTDQKNQENGLKTEATELDVDYLFDDNWRFSAGVRNDKREDNSVVVPLTQKQGERNDVALRATFDSRQNWLSYGYIQGTASSSGNREGNGRVGVGGDYRVTDRFKLDGELSSGDLGTTAKLGTQYKMTDATDLYSSYALENERTDNGVKARHGNLVSGFKSRYSDSASIYMEERYAHGDVPTGLTHSMGFDLAINDALNFGANMDIGTLKDNRTGAETNRTAVSLKLGYKFESLTYAGAIEYRKDETEQADTSTAERETWLWKNSLKYQLTEDWRVIAKLNQSESESSLGDFYDGRFTEAVVGYAFRPVNDDALNALFKYTYFYNMPTAGQVSTTDTTSQYIQKSQIVSVDASYDLTQRWTLGGKYAYRFGELSLDRENPEFFRSDAALSIIRVDWHITSRWDVLVEGRRLELPDAGDSRSGMLFAIYRHLGQNIKLGVGYNFTEFSDDLTDLDYDSQGLFINAIGKF